MEKYQEIERSIIKTYRGKLWAPFVRALKEYELIVPNDSVCVCISGGKDSMLLAKLFQELKRHSDFEFDVKYLVMNPGYNEFNLEYVKKNLEILNIPATIVNTDIFEIANSQDKNPCYLCAKMRRGALYRIAKDMGCNKIALGHHYDDVIETTLMNMLNAGSFQTMLPKLHSDNYEGMELIRPLYLIREKDIKAWAKYNDLKFIMCACRFTEACSVDNEINMSQRLTTKRLIQTLKKDYNELVEKNIFAAASNVNLNKIIGYKKDGEKHTFLEDYKGRRMPDEEAKRDLK
ncbi:tRNA(Ile)-lysidine synthase TilS/MesJ [Anaeroplasma bactoclasticum]|jgi:tRNA(Ile)-lysidine synthase TilS/MesJ|uniref:tRNA(Ile)-lysidine synthase TilS/MesJ n=1 Tax=Anaeroplasma bactoclasticum TaxID=2088 RepID=A0A397QUZ2_9MOLU|nr:tRNA 2-thiocytidine biosynthesis TtcA family protein [Anaeroplasma bactoclasticum]RIA64888.1 tRNA(Ile)-lysidine synthase TilS/MesJ [Anaeroplasma bactoclasticum]